MPGKRAKILSAPDVNDLLVFASCTRHPLRNAVIVLLSAKAGLRAGEIANLTWDMVVDANGALSGLLELRDTAAKKGNGRSIPIHPDLAAALAAWRQIGPPCDYVITSERGGRMTPLGIVRSAAKIILKLPSHQRQASTTLYGSFMQFVASPVRRP